jgi:integrase
MEEGEWPEEEYKPFTLASENKPTWKLPDDCEAYARPYFQNYHNERDLRDLVQANPRPDHFFCKAEKLDTSVQKGLKSKCGRLGEVAINRDSRLGAVQEKILRTTGPLGRIWETLDSARKSKADKRVDLGKLLQNVEQSMVLLGQAVVACRYNRRLEVMDAITKSMKESKQMLQTHDKELRDQELLFGKEFLEKVEKEEGQKPLEKGLFALTPPPTKRRRTFSPQKPGRSDRSSFKGEKRPFQGGSRYHQDGYGDLKKRGGFRGKSRGGAKNPRYVVLSHSVASTAICTEQSHSKHTEHTHSKHRTTVLLSSISHPTQSIHSTPHDTHSTRQGENRGSSKRGIGKLGEINKRPDHSEHGKRVLDSVHTDTEFPRTTQPQILGKRKRVDQPRSSRNDEQRCNKTGHAGTEPVCGSHISQRKERWRSKAYLQSQTAEHGSGVQAFQDGRSTNAENSTTTRRLDDQTGSKRCIPLCGNEPRTQEISEVQLERDIVRVPMSPLRARISPSGLYEASEAYNSLCEKDRNEVTDLPRRHADNASRSATASPRRQNFGQPLGTLGVRNQCTEIKPNPPTKVRVSGNDDKQRNDDHESPTEESGSSHSEMQAVAANPDMQSARSSRAHRDAVCNNDGDFTGTPPIPLSANAEDERTDEVTHLQQFSPVKPAMQTRVEMVATTPRSSEWQDHHSKPTGPDHGNGCKLAGLGSINEFPHDERALDGSRAERTDQCSRAESSLAGSSDADKTSKLQTRAHQIRQCHDSISHKQKRRHEIGQSDCYNKELVELLPGEKHDHNRRIPSGQEQHDSGRFVTRESGRKRLEAEREGVPKDQQSFGPLPNRFVCKPNEQTDTDVYELESRPGGSWKRRLDDIVERASRVCFPTILPHRQMPGENQEGGSRVGPHHSGMADATVVCSDLATDDTDADHSTQRQRSPGITLGRIASFDSKRHTSISGMEDFRQRKQMQGLSEDAAALATKAWRKGTRSAYDSAWAKWDSWCNQRSIDPVSSSVEEVAEFLTGMFKAGYEYSTINLHRSAISALHEELEGLPVGQHSLIKKIMTGVFQEKPPQPRYNETWDVDVVLQYISNLGRNEDLSDTELTHKLAMLLALTTASRVSEIQALNVEFMLDKTTEIVFTLPQHIKTTRVGQKPHTVTLQAYEQEELDVVACLRTYVLRTAAWRDTDSRHKLLLGTVAPHNPVKPCTVANWLKKLMAAAGIDVTKYKAHSTRAAATSKAKAGGLSVADILKQANWSRSRTFARYYDRDANDSKFAETVLHH